VTRAAQGNDETRPKPTLTLALALTLTLTLTQVCIKVAIINFTVTTRGLEDQLLGDLVRNYSGKINLTPV
jgi:hypothetical protein